MRLKKQRQTKKEGPTEKLTPAEKEFMKLHGEDLKLFMLKCSPCHSLERVFAKKRSPKEWDEIIKRMAGMSMTEITAEEQLRVRNLLTGPLFSLPPGP